MLSSRDRNNREEILSWLTSFGCFLRMIRKIYFCVFSYPKLRKHKQDILCLPFLSFSIKPLYYRVQRALFLSYPSLQRLVRLDCSEMSIAWGQQTPRREILSSLSSASSPAQSANWPLLEAQVCRHLFPTGMTERKK